MDIPFLALHMYHQDTLLDNSLDHLPRIQIQYILRKLEYYHEGRSEKHLSDIKGMLAPSNDQIDFKTIEEKIKEMGLGDEWK